MVHGWVHLAHGSQLGGLQRRGILIPHCLHNRLFRPLVKSQDLEERLLLAAALAAPPRLLILGLSAPVLGLAPGGGGLGILGGAPGGGHAAVLIEGLPGLRGAQRGLREVVLIGRPEVKPECKVCQQKRRRAADEQPHEALLRRLGAGVAQHQGQRDEVPGHQHARHADEGQRRAHPEAARVDDAHAAHDGRVVGVPHPAVAEGQRRRPADLEGVEAQRRREEEDEGPWVRHPRDQQHNLDYERPELNEGLCDVQPEPAEQRGLSHPLYELELGGNCSHRLKI
mmetsp:Transcript_69013/g.195589  ORF Transcript_69013/g.195589 Transcript_69013/m.195589 type:complete len:283 (+) Transcript_69013:572-1420(+)